MIVFALGLLLAAGALLAASPWLWPSGAAATRPSFRPGRIGALLASAGFAGSRPGVVVIVAGCLGVAAGALAALITGLAALAALGLLAGIATPFVWLSARARRLRARRRGLWPDVCELLVASVRSGMSLSDAVAGLAEVGPAALRPAFGAFARDVAASGRFDAAALALKERLADPVADRIVETLRMARQVGGTELVPVLRALAAAVRADGAVRAEVSARQSWTRAAAVLGVVAPWVVLALLSLRPEGAAAYARPEGVALIVGGAVVSVIAYRLMARIGRLREPRRWST